MPQVGLNFSDLQVVAAAGAHHQVNFDPFLAHGCQVAGDGSLEVLKSPVGPDAFCASFCQTVADKQLQVLDSVGALPDPQVGYYLLRHSCNASRMQFLSRTTPSSHCGPALIRFDAGVRAAFERLLGSSRVGSVYGLRPLWLTRPIAGCHLAALPGGLAALPLGRGCWWSHCRRGPALQPSS